MSTSNSILSPINRGTPYLFLLKSIKINKNGIKLRFSTGHFHWFVFPGRFCCPLHSWKKGVECPACREEEEDYQRWIDKEAQCRMEDLAYDDDLSDPCFDCDDLKVPYAARHCETCRHGTPARLLTEREKTLIKEDDDASWRFDMWGPDSI